MPKEIQTDPQHLIEAPDVELLPATTEIPVDGNWPDSLRGLPRSAGRTVLGIGWLAAGAKGPAVSQEVTSTFRNNLVRFGTSLAAISALAAGGVYGYKAIKNRNSSPTPEPDKPA